MSNLQRHQKGNFWHSMTRAEVQVAITPCKPVNAMIAKLNANLPFESEAPCAEGCEPFGQVSSW